MASIPPDVIRDILSPSHVKDLLRFRCVLKFFSSVIDCPDFIKLHLLRSQKTNTDLYGIESFVKLHRQVKLFDVSKSINDVSVVMVNQLQAIEPKQLWMVVGSCNGLIALIKNEVKGRAGDILIWNPFTRKSKKVASCIPSVPIDSPVNYSFGYDPKTDDYKLVRIVEYRDYSFTLPAATLKVFVYSLRTNSWKEIDEEWPLNCGYGSCPRGAGVLFNNALHWGVHFSGGRKIVAFDLINEEFYYVPVSCFECVIWTKLSVLDGCLAVSCRCGRMNFVWVMKEYSVQEYWTNVFMYAPFKIKNSDYMYALAYSNRRDKILFSCRTSWYWYDISSKRLDCCSNEKGYLRTREVKIFTASLVSPVDCIDVVDSTRKQTILEA